MIGRSISPDKETVYKVEAWGFRDTKYARYQKTFYTHSEAQADARRVMAELQVKGYAIRKPMKQKNRTVYQDMRDINNFILVSVWN